MLFRVHARLLAVAVMLLTVACSAPAGAPARDQGERGSNSARGEARIVYGVTQPIDVRPNSQTSGRNWILGLVSTGLTTRDPEAGRRALLAAEVPTLENGLWRVNADGTMVTTFPLRKGTWHDGAPLTADDFVFALEVGRDRGIPAFGAAAYSTIANASAPDPQTFVVEWNEPFVGADTLFTIDLGYPPPLPRHLLGEAAETNKTGLLDLPYWNQEYVGSGPFKVVSWDPGVSMQLVAHDGFAMGRPKIDRIDVQVIPDQNTLMANVLAGSVDVSPDLGAIDIGLELSRQWQNGTVSFNLGAGNWSFMIPQFIDPNPPIIADVRFRSGLAMAIDRQAIVDSVAGGMSPVPVSFLDPNQAQYAAIERSIPHYGYDPQRAGQLIAESGAVRGSDGSFRDSAGQALSVEIRTSPNVGQVKAATAIADDWRRAGVPGNPAPITPQLINDRSFTARFPGFWIRSGPTDVNALRGFTSVATPLASNNYVAPSPSNSSRYMSPELDDLIATYFRTIPMPQRIEVMGQIVHVTADNLTLLGLYYNTAPGAHSNRVTGVAPQWPSSAYPFNAHEWMVRS